MHHIFLSLHRHRKFQLIITSGTVVAAIVSFLAPDRAELVIAASTLTNLIWIWE